MLAFEWVIPTGLEMGQWWGLLMAEVTQLDCLMVLLNQH